jgi:cytochrome b
MSGAQAADGVRARLWDAPVRLVHWLLVGLIAFSWWSAEEGHLQWHRYSGYLILGLVAFRLYWGFAGGGAARFASFVRGPGAILAYLRTLPERTPSTVPGHNPLGALGVLASRPAGCLPTCTTEAS